MSVREKIIVWNNCLDRSAKCYFIVHLVIASPMKLQMTPTYHLVIASPMKLQMTPTYHPYTFPAKQSAAEMSVHSRSRGCEP